MARWRQRTMTGSPPPSTKSGAKSREAFSMPSFDEYVTAMHGVRSRSRNSRNSSGTHESAFACAEAGNAEPALDMAHFAAILPAI